MEGWKLADPLRTLATASLRDLLAPSLLADPSALALIAAVDAVFPDLAADADNAVLLGRVAELPARICDLLAVELEITPYRQGYTLTQKRNLVATAWMVHRRKGTADGVLQVIEALLTDGYALEEWYDYGGAPYHYRITGSNVAVDAATILPALRRTRRMSALFDGFAIGQATDRALYLGAVAHITVTQNYTIEVL